MKEEKHAQAADTYCPKLHFHIVNLCTKEKKHAEAQKP